MTVTALHPATLGGSTIAAAAGIDPYRSRARLYLELAGVISPAAESGPMRIGKVLEPAVVSLLPEHGYEVAAYPAAELRDDARPWLVGHPDVILADGSVVVGEVKVTGGWARRQWHDGAPPLPWQAQAQTYMHLIGADRALIAALIDGTHLELHELHRDERAITLLLERAAEFYEHLCTGTPPPFDGSADERDALHELFPTSTAGRKVRASRELAAVVAELRNLEAAAGAIKRQIEERRRAVEAAMGDAELLLDDADEELVRWRSYERTSVSTARLRAEYPAVYAALAEHTTARRFAVL